MSTKILCVDDDPDILEAYQRNLRKRFTIDTALGGAPALETIAKQGPYAVVVADMQMPAMNGIQLLTKVEAISPDTVRIMLTGNADQKTAADAVNQGHVFRFLNKPCSPDQLALTLTSALKQYSLITAERDLLENTLNGSVKLLTDILSMTDSQSFGQARALREAMRAYLKPLIMDSTWEFEVAAMLANIGRVTVPPTVLLKSRSGLALTETEKSILARIPETGANLLANIPRLETVARIIRYQGKHFDGSGFPADAIAGDNIPVAARILKVLSDVLEMEATGLSKVKVLEQMRHRTGWYDPQVLASVCASFDVYIPIAPEIKPAGRAIKARDLRIGQTLVQDLQAEDEMLIMTAGTKITQMIMAKIHNFRELSGLKEPIYVDA